MNPWHDQTRIVNSDKPRPNPTGAGRDDVSRPSAKPPAQVFIAARHPSYPIKEIAAAMVTKIQ
jgi:hypothetical protein